MGSRGIPPKPAHLHYLNPRAILLPRPPTSYLGAHHRKGIRAYEPHQPDQLSSHPGPARTPGHRHAPPPPTLSSRRWKVHRPVIPGPLPRLRPLRGGETPSGPRRPLREGLDCPRLLCSEFPLSLKGPKGEGDKGGEGSPLGDPCSPSGRAKSPEKGKPFRRLAQPQSNQLRVQSISKFSGGWGPSTFNQNPNPHNRGIETRCVANPTPPINRSIKTRPHNRTPRLEHPHPSC